MKTIPTPRCLVVIDSCFGGKFIPALSEGQCNAVVITASDDRNVAFKSGLADFWKALTLAESDSNQDGWVTVDEAFWSAFRKMLEKGEQIRQAALARAPTQPAIKRTLEVQGFATPQLDVLGEAKATAFGIKLPPDKPGKSGP